MHYVIAVPFRQRHDQLAILLPRLREWLPTQEYITSWEIIVVEQDDDRMFNLGWCINVGFALARARLHRTRWRYVFQPVDTLPIDKPVARQGTPDIKEVDVPDYAWRKAARSWKWPPRVTFTSYYAPRNTIVLLQPLYWLAEEDRWIHWGTYYRALTMDPLAYERINGHSNAFFGYGWEDDDLLARCEAAKGLRRIRAVRCPMLFHEHPVRGRRDVHPDPTVNETLAKTALERWQSDGLSNLQFTHELREHEPGVTWARCSHLGSPAGPQ